MARLFAVIRSRGAAWDETRQLEEQEDWKPHADFMMALEAEGFVALGGPLEGTADVLLIVRANDADEIAARLSADCWARKDLLRIKQILPWNLRLGNLAATSRYGSVEREVIRVHQPQRHTEQRGADRGRDAGLEP